MSESRLPGALRRFLGAATPDAWIEAAIADLPVLLVDHANCEKKAAASAISLMNRYADKDAIVYRMSRLAREELRHFERVHELIVALGWSWRPVTASRYAAGLRGIIATHEPLRLVDCLLVGAFIEARSCERFALLVPHLREPLATFYGGLLAAEARHFEQYLALARDHRGRLSGGDVTARIEVIRRRENELTTAPDGSTRFHSGPPLPVALSAVS